MVLLESTPMDCIAPSLSSSMILPARPTPQLRPLQPQVDKEEVLKSRPLPARVDREEPPRLLLPKAEANKDQVPRLLIPKRLGPVKAPVLKLVAKEDRSEMREHRPVALSTIPAPLSLLQSR